MDEADSHRRGFLRLTGSVGVAAAAGALGAYGISSTADAGVPSAAPTQPPPAPSGSPGPTNTPSAPAKPTPIPVSFVGGDAGPWRVERLQPVTGAGLPAVATVAMVEVNPGVVVPAGTWTLRGVVTNERYVRRAEHDKLALSRSPLGRPEATQAALIPLTKNAAWWKLSQDERRDILEERSHHIATGMKFRPAIAGRVVHGRDLGEPFDFVTWHEYAPADAEAFEELMFLLRVTEEWQYVEREVDIRLAR
jgi:chlorite dismutase